MKQKRSSERFNRLLRLIAEVERPNIARTKVSRDSDALIDEMFAALAPFVTTYRRRGYFTQGEREDLTRLFRLHAEKQYLLGLSYANRKKAEEEPLTQRDFDAITILAATAEQQFISSLPTSDIDKAAVLAGIAAAALGIGALSRGTTSHARLVQFATRRDSRVCPTCESFDGRVYEVDQITGIVKDGPLIPDDLHPRCRCRYVVLE